MALSVQVGDRIADRFEVFEIHEGGMGLVYSAHDQLASHGRDVVALKSLRDELVTDPVRSQRFATECGLWVQLGRHPNVVQAYEVIEIEGKPHIVLELVTGGELRRRIGTPALDIPHALHYGVEFCMGMEHAIRQGLRCHRDIKPGNLLVTGSETLKITDFGLASIRDEFAAVGLESLGPIPLVDSGVPQRIVWTDPRDQDVSQPTFSVNDIVLDQDRAESVFETFSKPSQPLRSSHFQNAEPDNTDLQLETTTDYTPPERTDVHDTLFYHLTRTGAILGTLPYMAPEQFHDAHSSDVRADIYSFGIVLFEMFTGELPFKGKNVAMLARQHAMYDPPSIIPSIPGRFARDAERIDRIVRRCLAKDPGDRFQTIVDLRRALSTLLRRIRGA